MVDTATSFWVLAFLTPLFWGIGVVIDKYVLSVRNLLHYLSYDVFAIWLSAPFAVLILLTAKVSLGLGAYIGIGVGFAYCFLYAVYDYGISKKDATDVIAITYTSPLFVAAVSWVILSEKLGVVNYLGVVLLMLSALVIGYKGIGKKNPALAYVLVFAVGIAIARVFSKVALAGVGVDAWSYLFWYTLGENVGAVLLGLALLKTGRLDSRISALSAKGLGIIVAGVILTFAGYYAFYSAISSGPVTSASGVTALTPSLVLVFSLAVPDLRKEALSKNSGWRSTLLRRVIAVILIVAGTLAIISGQATA